MQFKTVTEYSNELHQLLVSVSKHLYFGSDGYARYQDKPMDVNITNYHRSNKDHLVYYIIRDHFSGTFTFRIASTKRLIPLADFLYYAWSEDAEEEKFIYGMPDNIFIPQTISTEELFSGLRSLGINPLNPPSGFASGIRVIRDIEDNLCFHMGRTADHSLEGMNKLRAKVYDYLINSFFRNNYFDKWKANLPSKSHPKIVPPYADFIRHFSKNDTGSTGLILVSQERQSQKKKKAASVYPRFSQIKLDQAQGIIYDALDEPNRQKRLALARKALNISPYCADAYNLLAGESESLEERLELYEQGVNVGRIALGDSFFKENTGYFWGVFETRPYMRALAGFSGCLWSKGRRQEAIDNYQEMIKLNPNDNQGIRYTLINCLLTEGMNEEAEKLLSEYNESTCFMLYSQALLYFIKSGGIKSAGYLKQAFESNPYVPQYLLGKKHIPWYLPDMYSFGSEEEAIIYSADANEAWKTVPGALDWLVAELGGCKL